MAKPNNDINSLLECKKDLVGIYERSLTIKDTKECAVYLQDNSVGIIEKVRDISDRIEKKVSRKNWSIPTYEDIFNSLI